MKCCRQRYVNIYQARRRPRWQRYLVYTSGLMVLFALGWFVLRDTTPVRVKAPEDADLARVPGAVVGADRLDDVYWRVKMRHVNDIVSGECAKTNYSLFTNKNIEMDGVAMAESYVFICGNGPVINARAVISGQSVESVRCKETYASKTSVKVRKYPFSLKYISGYTFLPETKVIRTAVNACKWLHAIEIVQSRWD